MNDPMLQLRLDPRIDIPRGCHKPQFNIRATRSLSLYNHLAFDCRNREPSQLTAWHKQVVKTNDGSIMSFHEFVRDVSLPALTRKESEDGGSGRSSRHGLYATHLQKWFRLFDRKQILVLNYDELCADSKALQGRIEKFLGRTIPGKLRWANSNSSPQKVGTLSTEARQRLASAIEPHNEQLYNYWKFTLVLRWNKGRSPGSGDKNFSESVSMW